MGYAEVLQRIRYAERESGRPEGSVELVAISKVQPEERVRAVLDAGHRRFGENRVQEAQERWSPLRSEYSDVTLHLVGPLQTNKARAAVELFDVIESVDRIKLAEKIAAACDQEGRRPKLFVQVNTGEEAQKAGVAPAEVDGFIRTLTRALALPIAGLMAIPPADAPPSAHFGLLRKLAERNGLSELSMGMSGDFETAIQLGATQVRVGSAVFGERVKPAPSS